MLEKKKEENTYYKEYWDEWFYFMSYKSFIYFDIEIGLGSELIRFK